MVMASERGDSEEASQQFGDFTLLSKIGEGSSAEVYLARQNSLGVKVALKRWRRPLSDADRTAFLQECQLQRQLSTHPNIVGIRWAEAQPGQPPWIAMDLYEMSLQQRLQESNPIRPAVAFRWADEILAGLTAVHEAHHVHRDVKTANVLLADGVAALGDLGISMRVDASTSHSAAGTAGFVAPELANNGVPTSRTDVYSAGVTLRALFGDSPPEAVEVLLTRATSYDPADRPADAGDFRRRLAAIGPAEAGGGPEQSWALPISAGAGQPQRVASSASPARRRLLIISLVAVACAAIIVAGATLLRPYVPSSAKGGVGAPPAVTSSPAPTPIPTPPNPVTSSPIATPSMETARDPSPSRAPTSPTKPATGPTTKRTTRASAEPKPTQTARSKVPVRGPDGSSCYATALAGHFDLTDGDTIAGGPNYTSASCHDLHIKLTSAIYRTYARACFESPDGTDITHCGKWILLSYPNTWDTLATSVPAGSRWQLQMRADGEEHAKFSYTQ
jgi:serine/threonine-protein kinase